MFLAYIFLVSQSRISVDYYSYTYDKYMIFLTFSEMEEKLALQATLLKEKLELIDTRFRQLKQNLSAINSDHGNRSVNFVKQNEIYKNEEEQLEEKLKELKHSMLSSVLSIYHDYDFSVENFTNPTKNPNELQILESAVTKLRDNLDSPSERKHLNDVFTKQAVAKHLKRLRALESVSANLFQDIVRVRERVARNRDLSLKFASVLAIKNQTDIPSDVIQYISKTVENYKGNMIQSFPLFSEIFWELYLWRLCNRCWQYARQMFILFNP